MSRGFPSMTALLGLLAVAGYQNRDKIAEWLGGVGQQSASPQPVGTTPQMPTSQGSGGGLAGVLEQLRGGLSATTPGGILSGGLGELIDRFRQNGQGEAVDFRGADRPEPACHPRTARTRDRPGRVANLIAPDGAVAAGAARETFPRIAECGRPVYAARSDP